MIDVDAWPLPTAAYRPGLNARPSDESPLYAIATMAPAITEPGAWHDNAPYLFGFRLYAHGYFWEAHEMWEPVWMRARPNSRERALLQGLIQLANAGLKIALDRPAAARRLARLAAAHFADASAGTLAMLMGIDTRAYAEAVALFASEEGASIIRMPMMHYVA